MEWEVAARATRLAGGSMDDYLAQMRAGGAGMVECVKVVRTVEGVRLQGAKELVDESPVWADQREANMRLRASVLEIFEKNPPE